jgi:Phosphoesterase family
MFLHGYAGRHLVRADQALARGDQATADSHRSVAAAYQLFSDENNFTRERGRYLKPMAEFGTQTVPDLTYLAQPSTLANLRIRLPRTRDVARRARIADVLWEFGGDAAAASEAIASYETIASDLIGKDIEFATFQGAGALVRAYALARALNDKALSERLSEVVLRRIEELAGGNEHAALETLAELLVEVGGVDDAKLARVERALEDHLATLQSESEGTFTSEQRVLETLVKVARTRHNEAAAASRNQEIGESIAREGEWKWRQMANGGLVAGFFLEKAAKHFDALGDRVRAAQLRARERVALSGAEFHTLESEIEVDLKPYRRWLEKVFAANGPEAFWLAWLFAVPLPTDDEIAGSDARNRSVVDLFGMSTIDDDLIVDSPDPEESRRRRERGFAYLGIRTHVLNLFGVARDVFKVEAASAEAVLVESGRYDETARELLKRFLAAVDNRDFTSVYLSGPLFEKLVRWLGNAQQIPIRGARPTRFRGRCAGVTRAASGAQRSIAGVAERDPPLPAQVAGFPRGVGEGHRGTFRDFRGVTRQRSGYGSAREAPPKVDENGYGLRVPAIVISPYARSGYIDHQTLSFDAYTKFIEDVFLGGARLDPKTDGRPDSRPDVRETAPQLGDLATDFDFTQPPRPALVLNPHPSPGPPSR